MNLYDLGTFYGILIFENTFNILLIWQHCYRFYALTTFLFFDFEYQIQLSKWSNAMRKTTLVAWTYLTSVLFFLQQVVLKGMFTSQSVRPDIVLKSRQIVSRICQKRSHTSFYLKSDIFQESSKHCQSQHLASFVKTVVTKAFKN